MNMNGNSSIKHISLITFIMMTFMIIISILMCAKNVTNLNYETNYLF